MTSDEPPGTKLYGVTVFISNLSEDVWPFISNITDEKAKQIEIEENANLADRDLFSLAGEDRIVLITPKPVSKEFIEYFLSVFGKKRIEVLVPDVHTGRICDDIIKDQKIMNALVTIANSHKKLTLVSYSTSPPFLKLIRALKEKGLNVYTPESPEEEDAWTVNFFGSKSGIRQLAQEGRAEEPDLIMPKGFICSGIDDAAKIAAKKYLKEDGVVIKTNKGHSGMGVLIFRPGDLPSTYKEAENAILLKLKADSYWEKFPIVVEELIVPSLVIGGGFPNVEFKILKNGRVEFLYFCGMRITKEGVFEGIELNDDVISDRIEAQMIDTGFYIGEKYSQTGYRGYFDLDFIVARNGKVYVNESNVRRTGGTHVFETAKELFGKDFMYDVFVLSDNVLPLKKKYSFGELLKLFKPILFSRKSKEGLVVVSENLLTQNKLAYIIFGRNKKRALETEEKMKNLLI
jgi:hypothetical protein